MLQDRRTTDREWIPPRTAEGESIEAAWYDGVTFAHVIRDSTNTVRAETSSGKTYHHCPQCRQRVNQRLWLRDAAGGHFRAYDYRASWNIADDGIHNIRYLPPQQMCSETLCQCAIVSDPEVIILLALAYPEE